MTTHWELLENRTSILAKCAYKQLKKVERSLQLYDLQNFTEMIACANIYRVQVNVYTCKFSIANDSGNYRVTTSHFASSLLETLAVIERKERKIIFLNVVNCYCIWWGQLTHKLVYGCYLLIVHGLHVIFLLRVCPAAAVRDSISNNDSHFHLRNVSRKVKFSSI